MARFTLYCGEPAPGENVAEKIRSVGARLIADRPGMALIEATEEVVEQLRGILKNWRISKESRAHQNPPRPKVA